jgi:hypothetical protein
MLGLVGILWFELCYPERTSNGNSAEFATVYRAKVLLNCVFVKINYLLLKIKAIF